MSSENNPSPNTSHIPRLTGMDELLAQSAERSQAFVDSLTPLGGQPPEITEPVAAQPDPRPEHTTTGSPDTQLEAGDELAKIYRQYPALDPKLTELEKEVFILTPHLPPSEQAARLKARQHLSERLSPLERRLTDPDPDGTVYEQPLTRSEVFQVHMSQLRNQVAQTATDRSDPTPQPALPEIQEIHTQQAKNILQAIANPNERQRLALHEVLDVETARAMFTYPDVEGHVGHGEANNPNSVRYAQQLAETWNERGPQKMAELLYQMTQAVQQTLRINSIEPSPYAKSPVWAAWDIAKQIVDSKNPEAVDEAYRTREDRTREVGISGRHETVDNIADPTQSTPEAEVKRWDIIDRHVGWEVVANFYRSRGGLGAMHEADADAIDEILLHGQRNNEVMGIIEEQAIPSLRSYELSKIGNLARSSARLRGTHSGDVAEPDKFTPDYMKLIKTMYQINTWPNDTGNTPAILDEPTFAINHSRSFSNWLMHGDTGFDVIGRAEELFQDKLAQGQEPASAVDTAMHEAHVEHYRRQSEAAVAQLRHNRTS